MGQLEISIPFSGSRYLPPQAAGEFARALEQACGSQRPNGSAALSVGLPLQRT